MTKAQFVFTVIGLITLSACQSLPDDWLLKVDQSVITERRINGIMKLQKNSRYAATLDSLEWKHSIIKRTAHRILLGSYAKELNIFPDTVRLESTIKRVKESYVGETEFFQSLTEIGLTYEDWYEEMWQEFAADELLNQKITNAIQFPDSLIYDSLAISMETTRVRASHILRKVSANDPKEKYDTEFKRLTEIKALLEKSNQTRFAEMAKKFSEDNSSSQGGDLGYFTYGVMVEPFEKATFDLNVGELSDIVKTQFGLHLILLTDKVQVKPNAGEIFSAALNLTRQKKYQDLLNQLKKKYTVEISEKLQSEGFSF